MKSTDLGSPITKYHLQELKWKDLLRVFFPLLVIVLSPTVYGFWRTIYGYTNFGPAAAASWGRNWFLVGGILVILLLVYSLSRIIKAHTWVEIYSWGLLIQIPPGRKRILPWDDIFGITSYSIAKSFLGLSKNVKDYLVLHSRRYKPIKLHPDLKDISGLKKTLKKQVYARIKTKVIHAFGGGEIIPFGGLSISQKNIYLAKQEIPWDFIDGISVQKGKLTISFTEMKQIDIPIRNIYNLELLIHIIKTEI
jgi:hypothetical protein